MRHVALLLLVLATFSSSSRAYFADNVTVNGVTVAGGLFHTCMIVIDLSLRCFGGGSSDAVMVGVVSYTESTEIGFGNYGQIGSGDNETLGDEEGEVDDELAAVDLGGNTAQDVAAGQSHTCVVLTSGAVACFGFNFYGQLGLGDNITRGLSPSDMGENLTLVDLGTGRTATRIGSGYHHTCAVLDDGSLKCWGKNEQGMLGLGDTQNRGDSAGEMGDSLPTVDLGTGRTAMSVAGGRFHTCALLDNATLKCWGGGNSTGHNYGQLGQGNTFDVGSSEGQMGDALPAIDLGTNRTVVAFDVGDVHTCALLDNGSLKCFGRNFDGQLGLGDTEDRGNQSEEMGDDLPSVDLGTGRYAVGLTCGRWHTCVLLDNADVKCFGANDSNNLGAGQLGLEDTENRGKTEATTGDGLEVVQLGTGQTSGWIFAAFDHTCVIFDDAQVKCWGLNASGQLGLGHTDDVGAEEGTMGNSLTTVQPGLSRLAFPPSPAIAMNEESSSSDTTSASSDELPWYIILAVGIGALVLLVLSSLIIYRWLRRRLQVGSRKGSAAPSTFVPDVNPQLRHQPTEKVDISEVVATGSNIPPRESTPKALAVSSLYGRHPTGMRGKPDPTAIGPKVESREMIAEGFSRSRLPEASPYLQQRSHHRPIDEHELARGAQDHVDRVSPTGLQGSISQPAVTGSIPTASGLAAVGATGVMIAGGVYYGWEVVSRVAETLPWIGVAFCLLNDLVDIADAKFELEGNLGKMKGWALCLRDAILQISQQIEMRPSNNANTLKYMSQDVISSLEELVETVTQWEKKGMLAQYVASRSCKRSVDAADAALRGALQRLTFGQATELMTMVSGLESAGLVVTEKLDMVFEQLRRQDENAARLELRLAEYSEAVAEVLGLYMRDKGQATSSGKTLRELGKEALDRLQISSADVSYPSNVPFAAGTFSEVYQVIHKGTIKVAKKTNLSRFGLRAEDTDRVFGQFVKELYILSRMRSERVVTVHGAVATPTELTIIMEFVERGCLRAILDDDVQREAMTPIIKHGLLMDTAEGMNYLYNAGVEHRDLKSANCLVTHDWRIKISDFGLSNTTDAISTGSVSNVGSFRGGTLLYVAPELLVGGSGLIREVPAELSDVYSFGVIVWDVICGNGELPWANLSTTSLIMVLRRGDRLKIRNDCSDFYRTLMNDCWAHDPNHRPTFKVLLNILKGEMPRAGAAQSWPTTHARPTVKATRSSALGLHSSAEEGRETISTSQVDQTHFPRPSTGERPPPPPYRDVVNFQARLGKS